MTGTFDDWGKTVRLEKKGDRFERRVELSGAETPVIYKVRLSLLFDPAPAIRPSEGLAGGTIAP